MKVISGKLKGRTIYGYKQLGTRPTMDRVKESLFAMIQNEIENSTVLDLFAGSGNLGIEALSQGALSTVFVDHSRQAVEVIKENIKCFQLEEVSTVYCLDFKKALALFAKNAQQFSLIFLDPPYDTNYIKEAVDYISKNHLLKKDGLLVCESDQLEKIEYGLPFVVQKEKKYGDKYIVILKQI